MLVPLFGVLYIVFYVVFPMSFSSEPDILHLYMEMVYNSFQVCSGTGWGEEDAVMRELMRGEGRDRQVCGQTVR